MGSSIVRNYCCVFFNKQRRWKLFQLLLLCSIIIFYYQYLTLKISSKTILSSKTNSNANIYHNDDTLTESSISVIREKSTVIEYCDLIWSYNGMNNTQYEVRKVIAKSEIISLERHNVEPIFDEPTISLDPDRFLHAVLRWGPNNQLYGFHEAVILSIALNRTVVLPKFFKHERDSQHPGAPISPIHRIDIETLCRFVSCITLDTFQKTCDYQIDGILDTKILSLKDIGNIEKSVGIKILSKISTNLTVDLSKYLIPRNGLTHRQKFTLNEAKSWFNTSARCVLYPYPMFDIQTYNREGSRVKLHETVRNNYPVESSSTSSADLYTSVMQHYKRPAYIRKLSEDFIRNKTKGQPFLSVHWRYNKNDFLSPSHCDNKDYNLDLCNRAKQFTTEDFAARIEEKIQNLKNKNYTVRHIYIATPPNELDVINKVAKFLRDKQGWETHTSAQFMEMLKQEHNECKFIWNHFNDIVSTSEMEICSRGLAFLGSRGTTWTGAVIATRIFGSITGIERSYDGIIL